MNGRIRRYRKIDLSLFFEVTNTEDDASKSNQFSFFCVFQSPFIKGNKPALEGLFQSRFSSISSALVFNSHQEEWKALILPLLSIPVIAERIGANLSGSDKKHCCWLTDQLPQKTGAMSGTVTACKSILGQILNLGKTWTQTCSSSSLERDEPTRATNPDTRFFPYIWAELLRSCADMQYSNADRGTDVRHEKHTHTHTHRCKSP